MNLNPVLTESHINNLNQNLQFDLKSEKEPESESSYEEYLIFSVFKIRYLLLQMYTITLKGKNLLIIIVTNEKI